MGRIKGIGYKAELQFVRSKFGEEALGKILSTLPAEDQAALKGMILASDWYPQAPLERFRQAVATHAADADLRVIEDMGRFSAEFALTGIYRVFLAVLSPAYAIKKAGNLFPKYFDSGKAEVMEHGPKDVSVRIADWPDASATLCTLIKGYFERSLELAGGRMVVVRKTACVNRGDPFCEYRAFWV
jgi:hypothetical protein